MQETHGKLWQNGSIAGNGVRVNTVYIPAIYGKGDRRFFQAQRVNVARYERPVTTLLSDRFVE